MVRSLPMTRNRSQAPHTLAINNYRHKSRHSKCCKESLEFNRALNKVVTTEIDTQTMMKMMNGDDASYHRHMWIKRMTSWL